MQRNVCKGLYLLDCPDLHGHMTKSSDPNEMHGTCNLLTNHTIFV